MKILLKVEKVCLKLKKLKKICLYLKKCSKSWRIEKVQESVVNFEKVW